MFPPQSAIQQRCRKGRMGKEHWLDYADEKYDVSLDPFYDSQLTIDGYVHFSYDQV